MTVQIVTEKEFRIGQPSAIKGPALQGSFLAVLEDDGSAGYFYALDTAKEQPFQDGMLIYTIDSAVDKPYIARIGWSPDSTKVILTINDYPNALFDFTAKEGCCRTGYPKKLGSGWSARGHTWREDMLSHFASPTRWAPLVQTLTDLCSIDSRIEDNDSALVIDTSPTGFLEAPQKIEQLFQGIRQELPNGAELSFYNHGTRIIMIASCSKFITRAIVSQRGYMKAA